MVLLVKQNGKFDIEHRRKLHRDLTRLEATEFLKTFGVSTDEIRYLDETKNAHFFGDLAGLFLYSKQESEDFLTRREIERTMQ